MLKIYNHIVAAIRKTKEKFKLNINRGACEMRYLERGEKNTKMKILSRQTGAD